MLDIMAELFHVSHQASFPWFYKLKTHEGWRGNDVVTTE
jgi:hypothetical protein